MGSACVLTNAKQIRIAPVAEDALRADVLTDVLEWSAPQATDAKLADATQ